MIRRLIFLGLLVGLTAGERKDFTGYKVIRVPIANDVQARAIFDLSSLGVDFWTLPSIKTPAELLIPPGVLNNVTRALEAIKAPYSTEIDDVESAVEEERKANRFAQQRHLFRSPIVDPLEIIHDHFGTFQQIQEWLDLAVRRHSNIASLETIGRTHEGRNLTVLKISNGGTNKPAIWVDGGIHAREWIAPSTAIYIAWEILARYESGVTRSLVDQYDWYFLPVANPDGYVHSHETNRLWRKNRRPSGGDRNCYGVDPNRNFAFHWAEPGTRSSSDPCTEIYHGPHPSSEYESYYMQRALLGLRGRLQVYLSLHCYGQMWFIPFGYTNREPADNAETFRVASLAREAVFEVHQKWYEVGKPGNLMYRAGGGSYDWAKGVANAKYSLTVELRPTLTEAYIGFILHPSYIRPTGEEIWAGVKKMVEVMVPLSV